MSSHIFVAKAQHTQRVVVYHHHHVLVVMMMVIRYIRMLTCATLFLRSVIVYSLFIRFVWSKANHQRCETKEDELEKQVSAKWWWVLSECVEIVVLVRSLQTRRRRLRRRRRRQQRREPRINKGANETQHSLALRD